MRKAMEDNNKKREVTGAIKAYRLDGASDEAIIKKVMSLYRIREDHDR